MFRNKFVEPRQGAYQLIKKHTCLKEQWPLIKCECGAEILLVPTLELMSQAIEAHVEEHKQKEPNKTNAEATAERIRKLLIAQVLEKASAK